MNGDSKADRATIVVVGVFRSGTNYLRSLLELNFRTRVSYNAYGWKHGLVPIVSKGSSVEFPNLPRLVIARNPFSAIEALFRYVVKAGANIICRTDWHGFLRERLIVHDKWNPGSAQLWFANPAHYWTAMNWNHLSAGGSGQPVCLVRYEDLLADPRAETDRIAAELRLDRLPGLEGFVDVEQRVKAMNDRDRSLPEQYVTAARFNRRDFYLSHAYMERFDKEDRSLIEGLLDWELLERMGYDGLVRNLMAWGQTSTAVGQASCHGSITARQGN